MADFLTEPEIVSSIVTDTYQIARHPALKEISSILGVFVNKFLGGGQDKIRFDQLDLMPFFKAVLQCDQNNQENWLIFQTAFQLLFAHLQVQRRALLPLPEQEAFEEYKYDFDTIKFRPQSVPAFDEETPARRKEILKVLVATVA